MKRKMKLILVSALAVVSIGLFSGCGPWHKSPEEKAEYMVKKVTKKLELSDEQLVKLNTLKDEILVAGKAFQEGHDKAHAELLDILGQSTLDQSRILNLISGKTQFVNEKAPQLVSAMGDFYDSLSAEQQAEIREHMEDKIEHHNHHRGWH